MENLVVVDTDILVGVLRGDRGDINTLKNIDIRTELATTDLNAFELYYGACRSKNKTQSLDTVDGLLRELRLLHTTEAAMRRAGRIAATLEKKGSSLDFKDILIASIVLDAAYSLLTRNTKHFGRIEGLKLVEF